MKPARLLILGVAVVAAGLAGVLAMSLAGRGSVVTQVKSVVEKEPTVKILVSGANLPVGARLDDKAVHWMAWPQNGVVQGFITETDRPDAIKELGKTSEGAGALVAFDECDVETDEVKGQLENDVAKAFGDDVERENAGRGV